MRYKGFQIVRIRSDGMRIVVLGSPIGQETVEDCKDVTPSGTF
jgi:hypothetical protein